MICVRVHLCVCAGMHVCMHVCVCLGERAFMHACVCEGVHMLPDANNL